MTGTLILIALVACGESSPPPATPAAPDATGAVAPHAEDGHAHAAPHGGIVKTVGGQHIEAVFTPGGILFYPSGADGTALPVEGFAGSAA